MVYFFCIVIIIYVYIFVCVHAFVCAGVHMYICMHTYGDQKTTSDFILYSLFTFTDLSVGWLIFFLDRVSCKTCQTAPKCLCPSLWWFQFWIAYQHLASLGFFGFVFLTFLLVCLVVSHYCFSMCFHSNWWCWVSFHIFICTGTRFKLACVFTSYFLFWLFSYWILWIIYNLFWELFLICGYQYFIWHCFSNIFFQTVFVILFFQFFLPVKHFKLQW